MLKIVFSLLVFTICFPAFAAEKLTQKEMELGRQSYAAFECAITAGMADMEEENTRLSLLALNAGKNFFEASQTKEVNPALIDDNTSFVLATLDGINTDFMLGRLYQNRYEVVFEKVGNPMNVDIQKENAEKYFKEKNCGLIK